MAPSLTPKMTLGLIILVAAAPFLASTVAYYAGLASPKSTLYGQLLTPITPLDTQGLLTAENQPITPAQFREKFRGKWQLLTVVNDRCDLQCDQQLAELQRIRQAQGRDSDAVVSVLVIEQRSINPLSRLNRPVHNQARVFLTKSPSFSHQLAQFGAVEQALFVIDPLGNRVIRYSATAKPSQISRELGRLLKQNAGLRH